MSCWSSVEPIHLPIDMSKQSDTLRVSLEKVDKISERLGIIPNN